MNPRMKIVLATPLYPPDIAEPAPYVKELARRLSKDYEVTVVAYGRLPEKIEGVSFVSVDKRRLLFVRLIHYTFALMKAAHRADILYAENGASVELPAGLVSLFARCPLIIHIGDIAAHKRASGSLILRFIEHFVFARACKIIENIPVEKPEILPFSPTSQTKLNEYDISWSTHIATLEDIFKHGQH